MRWEDERYVRVYTRDTADWLSLSFEAQGLLILIFRKVDRAGVMELGRHGARGVAVAVGHAARWETVRPALDELLDDGVCVLESTRLVVRNFLEAQEATASDKARQRKRRELASVLSQTVTKSHDLSRAVTSGHAASRAVTPNLAVPSRAVPSEKKPLSSSSTDLELTSPEASDPVLEVFAHWREVMRHPRAKLDTKRRQVIRSRVVNGYSAEDLKRAIDGCAKTPHNMGENERGARYDSLELILRNADQVDRFMANATNPPSPKHANGTLAIEEPKCRLV